MTVDLLQPDQLRQFLARPEHLRERVHQQPDGQTILIDEVQKAPQLLDVVHSLIEEHRGWRFILTGSSARKLRRGGVDLMAGRAIWRELHPYLAAELGEDFNMERALRLGMLPVVVEADDPAATLAAYAGLYLREEIQQEGLVRNLADFARFLEVLSFSHGQVVNISNIARECHTERTTVAGFLGIVDDLLIGFRLPVFEKRARRAVVAHPKFFFFDTGVFRSLRPAGPLDRPSEIDGAALEGLVAQHLRAWLAYSRQEGALYYWRTRGGTEVDFVIYGGQTFTAIEVKNAATVQRADLRGLAAFRSDYPEAQPLLLYRGTQPLRIDDIPCLPCDAFLHALHPDTPLIPDHPRGGGVTSYSTEGSDP
jgi:predicted AAA+ superfamily ATPase